MTQVFNIVVAIVTSLLSYFLNGVLPKVKNESLQTALKYLVTLVVGIFLGVLKGLMFSEFTWATILANLAVIMSFAAGFYGLVLKPATEAKAATPTTPTDAPTLGTDKPIDATDKTTNTTSS